MLGRFISPDSIVANPSDATLFNRFAYVGNNPLKFTDPTGHDFGCDTTDCHGADPNFRISAVRPAFGGGGEEGGGISAASASGITLTLTTRFVLSSSVAAAFNAILGPGSILLSIPGDTNPRIFDDRIRKQGNNLHEAALDAGNSTPASPDPNGFDPEDFGGNSELERIRNTFEGGKAKRIVLKNNAEAFRFSGGGPGPEGRYLTTQQTLQAIDSPADARAVLQLQVSGNTATSISRVLIPKNTVIYVGRVAGGPRGATQIYVPRGRVHAIQTEPFPIP